MDSTAVVHDTFVVKRELAQPPERVFAAFADPLKKRRWFAEGEHHQVDEFQMDFRVGGVEKLSYRLGEGTPFPGVPLLNDGVFLDILENRRLVIASSMIFRGVRISATMVTFELLRSERGTTLILTHQGAFFEGSDGPQMREAGWKALLARLEDHLTN